MADKLDRMQVSDELDLIIAVLRGYRDSPAKADAMRAVGVIRAEVETLRKDAERYRWLRDKSGYVNIVGGGGKFNLPDYQEVNYLWRRREWVDGKPILVLDGLDAAIDAALAARPGGRG